ncbi:putative cytochrome P450 monooxygenase [Xylaria intraflava]|nr:putative cytochrome P450 monooxygenase [Xylaria intraflava]
MTVDSMFPTEHSAVEGPFWIRTARLPSPHDTMIGTIELAQIGLFLFVVYMVGSAIYNVFFHPLRHFPGPLSHRLSILPHTRYQVYGCLPFHVSELHKLYGPVVRIAPDELAFCSPQAWHDIYGHRKAGAGGHELPKYDGFYNIFDHIPTSILNSGNQEHSVLRRLLAHGFSDRAMREQEPIICSYVNLLISRLHAAAQKTTRQNLREWYNWTVFDVIGDLSFGVEGGFGCLKESDNHPWVTLISSTVSQSSIVQALCRLGLQRPMVWLSKSGVFADDKHLAIVYEKVGQRMESGERPGFMEGLISNKHELGLTQGRLATNASLLIRAGSETTATLLSGATYFLTTHPEILERLQQEVRLTFKSDEEITLTSVGSLSYMLACLNESLRCYPPVVSGLPRLVPKGGATIDGKFVPEGTIVSVFQWAINRDESLWTEPERFAPERWLGDPKYKDDQLDAMQPFSVGPRNCIGRTLAYAEMRLILAKIVYNFDISMDSESRDWLRSQKAYTMWDKPALHVHLKPVAR